MFTDINHAEITDNFDCLFATDQILVTEFRQNMNLQVISDFFTEYLHSNTTRTTISFP